MKPIHFSELIPRESTIKIFDKVYKLKPFTIAIETWAYYEFQTKDEKNGVKVLSDRLRDFNDKEAVLKCIYKLLVDKNDFDTYEKFIEKLDTYDRDKFYIFLTECYYSLSEAIGISQPVIENIEEELELKKYKAVAKI